MAVCFGWVALLGSGRDLWVMYERWIDGEDGRVLGRRDCEEGEDWY